jgi:hypothetical protein
MDMKSSAKPQSPKRLTRRIADAVGDFAEDLAAMHRNLGKLETAAAEIVLKVAGAAAALHYCLTKLLA